MNESFGQSDVIGIGTAGGTEVLLPVWHRLFGAAALDSKIVR